ncbi:MAG TPA: hypothetical protein VNT26_20765 [Candidatus Sulfotelmatobacter sp.]|nr:hypothetical protein [Candidatus Sulfotelmatobacter sp.]HWI56089.1 hypothetical protein [Bacillota bacterium]
MTARLFKETRDLLPLFVGTVLFIALPYAIWGRQVGIFGCLACAVGCGIMAGSAFGGEFQHRTLSLLLAQPVPRRVVWREKMGVLGTAIAASLGVLWACLVMSGLAPFEPAFLGMLGLIGGCAFCGAPYWTLLLRNGMAGMVFAVAVPGMLVTVVALVSGWISYHDTVQEHSAMVALFCYCPLVYWRGFARFTHLQVVDGTTRELSLPAGLEPALLRPLRAAFGGFSGPWANLIKKEFRLQQVSFLMAGLFCLIVGVGEVAGACLHRRYPDMAAGILALTTMFYGTLLPLLAGAMAVAEERGWGIAEWHLTLPPSARQQWWAKMLVILPTSVSLGVVLPAALILAHQALVGEPGARLVLPPAQFMVLLVLGQLLVTSLATFMGSVSSSTLRAILWAFGLVLALLCCFRFGVFVVEQWALGGKELLPILSASDLVRSKKWAAVTGALLLVMVALAQWFAFRNFREHGLPTRQWVIQTGALCLVFWLLVLVSLLCFPSITR